MAEIARWATRTGASVENIAIRLGARHGALLLRLSLGIVFLWFALPKFIPGLSAADPLARKTIDVLTAHMISGDPAVFLLALLETAIGIGFLTGWFPRLTIAALLFQMAGTLTPLVLFPDETWKSPFVLSLEGQFIVKNLVLIAAGIAMAGTLRRIDTLGGTAVPAARAALPSPAPRGAPVTEPAEPGPAELAELAGPVDPAGGGFERLMNRAPGTRRYAPDTTSNTSDESPYERRKNHV